jgi:hypothetical protein
MIKIENISEGIANGKVSVFSNSPSFLFTYAYVVNKDGFLITELKTKVSKKAISDKPSVTNPTEVYGFEKSIYFALLYLRDLDLYKQNELSKYTMNTKTDLLNDIKNILSCEQKLDQYNKVKRSFQNKKASKKANKK